MSTNIKKLAQLFNTGIPKKLPFLSTKIQPVVDVTIVNEDNVISGGASVGAPGTFTVYTVPPGYALDLKSIHIAVASGTFTFTFISIMISGEATDIVALAAASSNYCYPMPFPVRMKAGDTIRCYVNAVTGAGAAGFNGIGTLRRIV